MPTSADIDERAALTRPRFEFIADWLIVFTRRKENRGPLGQYVRRRGKTYEVMSGTKPIAVYATHDPSLLFDYARWTQLGSEIRRAEGFREEAYHLREAAAERAIGRTASPSELRREIEDYLAGTRQGA